MVQPLRSDKLPQGILVCIGGLGMLVASDKLTAKDFPAASLVKGDIFMIVGASLYGFSVYLVFTLKLAYADDFHAI
jgi:Solute carrier family 35